MLEYSQLTVLCEFQVDSKVTYHTCGCIHSPPDSPPTPRPRIQAAPNAEQSSLC